MPNRSPIQFFKKTAPGLGTLLTVFSSAIAIFIFYFPSGPTQDPDFFGQWDSRYHFQWQGEDIVYRGNIQFVRNGRYNVKGVFSHLGQNNGVSYRYSVQAQGSGNWSTNEGFLTFTLTNLRKDLLDYVVTDGEVPEAVLNNFKKMLTIELNEKYVPGNSDEYKIVSVSKNKLLMEGKDPQGRPFAVINVRQDSIL